MKRLLMFSIILFGLSGMAFAQYYGDNSYVQGYTNNNGTYVQPYYRTTPDRNVYNNYSTQGNVNPYTGNPGYVNPNRSYQMPTNGGNYQMRIR